MQRVLAIRRKIVLMCSRLIHRSQPFRFALTIQASLKKIFLCCVIRTGYKIDSIILFVYQADPDNIIIPPGDQRLFLSVPAYPVNMAPTVLFRHPQEFLTATDPIPAGKYAVLPGSLTFDIGAVFLIIHRNSLPCSDITQQQPAFVLLTV